MIRLIRHHDFQSVQKLSFCYLCGKGFEPDEPPTRDHVPPKTIFAGRDRFDPLVLPTHSDCNEAQSRNDEAIGQLLGVSHGRAPKTQNMRLRMDIIKDRRSGTELLGIRGIDLRGVIARWVRGFHSALYGTFLPNDTPNAIHPPFPSGQQKEGGIEFDGVLVQHPVFVEVIKANRAAGRIDEIVCYNRQCRYECVWEQSDSGEWMCILALQIYRWKELAERRFLPARGCVGFYTPREGAPVNAARGIVRVLDVPASNVDSLDAFGS